MRARSIKPSFFKSDTIAELPFWVRILFQGLWSMADRRGIMEDRVKKIKAEIFPYDDVDVESGLILLSEKGFIIRYRPDSGAAIGILNFSKHQHPHPKEPDAEIEHFQKFLATANSGKATASSGEATASNGKAGTGPSGSCFLVLGSCNPLPETGLEEKIVEEPKSENVFAFKPKVNPNEQKQLDTAMEHEQIGPGLKYSNPCEWFIDTFLGEVKGDTWRSFGKYVASSELLLSLLTNHPLWMKTRKWQEGFTTDSEKYLKGQTWIRPPTANLFPSGFIPGAVNGQSSQPPEGSILR
jgi:hypothetical protein